MTQVLVLAVVVIGTVLGTVGNIMVLVAAFRTSAIWGLVSLLIPFGVLVYTVKHWYAARRGFLLSLAGALLALFGIGLGFLLGIRAPGGADPSEIPADALGDSQAGLYPDFTAIEPPRDPLLGLTPVEVRRAIGNPTRGEGTRGGRMMWFYEDRDLIFEGGRVVEIVILF